MYKTVYTICTNQYTWKVTVKGFIIGKIASLRLTASLKLLCKEIL